MLIEHESESEHLTGDWGGWRTRLLERGIHLQAGYIGEVFGNASGGIDRGVVYEGVGEIALELDLQSLTRDRWRGAVFRASTLWTHGDGPTEELAGDALGASNIEAHDSIRLYELWLEQSLFDEAISIRAGNLLADAEFAVTDFGGLFLNSAFGWPAFISGNTLNGGPAFPVSALGVRLRWQPVENWFVQAGVFDGDSFDSDTGDPEINEDGLNWKLSRDQGVFAIMETGLHWGHENGEQLHGSFKVGGWLHTADFPDNYYDDAGGSFIVSGLPPRMHAGSFGVYGSVEHMLWREPVDEVESTQGLGAFVRAGGSPDDRAAFDFVADCGLHYTGLLPGRDEDQIGLGLIYASVSPEIRRSERDDRNINGALISALSDHEMVIEATYHLVLRPWWSIQPDVQWIHHPGGSGAISDAWLLGLRTSITF